MCKEKLINEPYWTIVFFGSFINLFMQIPSSRDKILDSAIKSNVKNKQFLTFVKIFNIL